MPPRKKTASKSRKRKRAAAHGGARAGAGRKRVALSSALMARIGDPPIGKPMQLAIWYQNAITVLTGELLKGKDVGKLLESVRASSGAVARAMPLNVIHAAGVRLDEDEREMNDDVGAAGTVERKDDHVAQQHARAVRRDPS